MSQKSEVSSLPPNQNYPVEVAGSLITSASTKHLTEAKAEGDQESPSCEQVTETHPTLPLPNEIPSLDCPTQVGPYPIRDVIGAGGMGVVLRGYDGEFNRTLAVKLLQFKHKKNTDLANRFLEEAQIMGQLQHPNIPPVHHLGMTTDGRPFFTMKLIKGQTLTDLLKARRKEKELEAGSLSDQPAKLQAARKPPLTTRHSPPQELPRFIAIFEKVCKALAYAHSRGIIHRDLKPGNIMVGAFDEVYVMDWGMAKVDKGRIEQSTELDQGTIITVRSNGVDQLTRAGMGTVGFMPPEQILGGVGQVDARSDVFGLGAMLSVILTGMAPYQVENKQELLDLVAGGKLCADCLGRLDDCKADPELVELAKRCLANQKEDRPNNAGEVAEAIAIYQAKVQEERRQLELKRAQDQVKRLEKRKQRRLIFALALVAVFAGGSWLLLNEETRKHDQESSLRKAELKLKADALFSKFYSHLAIQRVNQAESVLEELKKIVAQLDTTELSQDLSQAGEDLKLIQEWEGLHNGKAIASPLPNQSVTNNFADKQFEAILKRHGYWKNDEPAWITAERIKNSRISTQLIAALDEWHKETKNSSQKAWLEAVLKINGSLDNSIVLTDHDRTRELLEKKVPASLLLVAGQRQLHLGGNPLAGLKEVVERSPDSFWGHIWLGNTYLKLGKYALAEQHFTIAMILRRDNSLAWNNLGCAQLFQGKFLEAETSLARALKVLGPTDDVYHRSVREHFKKCQKYRELDQNLPEFLKKNRQPKTAMEALELADLCFRFKNRYLDAAIFSASAFTKEPKLAQDLGSAYRYQAARCAILAAEGRGLGGADKLSLADRKKWRNKALAWLQAELSERAKLAKNRTSQVLLLQKATIELWLQEADLASVRDADLSHISEAERGEWANFWLEVNVVIKELEQIS